MSRLHYELTAYQENVLIHLDQRIPKIVENYIFNKRKTVIYCDTVTDRYHWSEAKALDNLIYQLDKPGPDIDSGTGSSLSHCETNKHIINMIMTYLDRKYCGLVSERKLVDPVIQGLREEVDTLRCLVEFPRTRSAV